MHPVIYTIGHSNLNMTPFLKLLRDNNIQVLVDVRSSPYSRHVPQFNKKEIEAAAVHAGLKYIFMGDVVGGKPLDPIYLDEDGRTRYDRLAASERFRSGLDRLIKGYIEGWIIGLMCAEEDPLKCHRHHLIARELELKHHVPVWHIRADNTKIRAKDYQRDQLKLF